MGDQWSSLPEYFKNHGFLTLGSGKNYHPTVPPNNDQPRSWSQPYPYYCPECIDMKNPNGIYHCVAEDQSWCAANTTANETRYAYQLEDQKIRDNCLDNLMLARDTLASTGRPFFLACGFHKVGPSSR